MPDRIVIDASVAIALLRQETGSWEARRLVTDWTSSGADLLVPSHFWVEVTNVLMRRLGQSVEATIEGLVALDGIGVQTVELDRPLLLLSINAMGRFGLSGYDAMDLALARSTHARLATFDERLASAAIAFGLLVEPEPPTRISEEGPAYGTVSQPDWAYSAVVGRHIAELRQRAMVGD